MDAARVCGDAVGVETDDGKMASEHPGPNPTGKATGDSTAGGDAGQWRRRQDRRDRYRSLGLLLVIVLLVGLPIRAIVIDRAAMVSRDTVTFIWFAQAMQARPLGAVRDHEQHPLYPALVLAAHRAIERLPIVPASVRDDVVRSWSAAAMAVSLIGGLLVIAASYLLATRLFDRNVGLVAALLAAAAAEFCQLSGDGLSDMPHLAVYLAAMWAALGGFDTGRARWFALAGLLAGVGFLFRPEGAEPAVVGATLLAIPKLFRLTWRKRLIGLASLAVAAGCVATPYMLLTGRLVQKKSIDKFLPVEVSAASDKPRFDTNHRSVAAVARADSFGDVARAVPLIVEDYIRSLRGTYLLPLIAWLVWRRQWPASRTGTVVVPTAIALHVLILIGLIVRFDYQDVFSIRHVMVLTGLSLPFVAAGVAVLIGLLPDERQGWAALLLGAALIAPTLPWMLEARHRDDAHYRTAGEWIHANSPVRPRVLTSRFRMAFYARGDYIPAPPEADAASYMRNARATVPDWIAFDERRILRDHPAFFEELSDLVEPGERLEPIRVETNRVGGKPRRVLVYRYERLGHAPMR